MFTITGATPGETSFLAFAMMTGEMGIPGCEDVLGVESILPAGSGVADASGVVTITVDVPGGAGGGVGLFQGIEKETCSGSQVVGERF